MNRLTIRFNKFYFRQKSRIFIAFILIGFFFIAILTLFHFEKQANPNLSFFDAFRIVLVFFLGEYGDTPQTEIGRVVSLMSFLFGIVIVATIIARITAIFVNLKWESKMLKHLDSHIIICNWNDKGDRVVKELHSSLASPETEIIIITQQDINETELRANPEYERVFFIRSDPTLHDVLKRARAHLARSVIILADPNTSDSDAKSALIALAISKLEKDSKRKPQIIAEAVNHRKIQHLEDAGVDEWICSTDYGLGIIAQCALYSKLSDVYQQLLMYSEDTNEIYMVDNSRFPKDFIGKSFYEVARVLNETRNSHNPVILVGVKRDDRVILNPRDNEFDRFKDDDNLIVISFDPPDLHDVKASSR